MAKYSVARLQEFFFEAALATYASGKEAAPFPELAGAKCFLHQRGELCYGDVYLVNGEYSGGQTLIWVHGVPAWLMQYHGWCKSDDREVLTFLKQALVAAYAKSEFRGGRGPKMYTESVGDRTFLYGNKLEGGDFTRFLGGEGIYDKQLYDQGKRDRDSALFWHHYQGLLLGEAE
ncbi:hypothetical protein HY573_01880 [Candidatus Parcubacteria bacterium]|nr:hypothetical protein [Candidatus Parcubacteria bacterium]